MNNMQFFAGAVHGIYFIITLLAGLELWFDIFRIREKPITILMRGMGTVMLLDCCAIFFNALSVIQPEEEWLFDAMVWIDICVLMTYYLSISTIITGRWPKPKWLVAICLPYLVCIALSVAGFITPSQTHIVGYALSYPCFFVLGVIIYRRSRIRRKIYSDPDNKLGLWAIGIMIVTGLNPVIFTILVLMDAYNELSITLVLLYFAILELVYSVFAYHHDMEVDGEMEEELDNISGQLSVKQERHLSGGGQERNSIFIRLTEEEKIYRDPNIGLESLAERMGINRTYLYMYLRDVEKTTFTDYVNSHRIADAKLMLVNTDDRIADIARNCGFNSIQSFNRVFKRYTGSTPSEFRN